MPDSYSGTPNQFKKAKHPVDPTLFMKTWHEESRISSPTAGYDSPKGLLYLNAAKYHRDQQIQHAHGGTKTTKTGVKITESGAVGVHNFVSDAETNLLSEFDKSRNVSQSPKGSLHGPAMQKLKWRLESPTS